MYKLLTFLGTTPYEEVYYTYRSITSRFPARFVQISLLELLHDELKDGQVILFLTEEAENKNWLNRNQNKNANFLKGLRDSLEEFQSKFNIDLEVKRVRIPEGRSEEELWTIFEKMNEVIDENDRIILDITHSFRSLPLLTLIVLNYAKFLKNVRVERVLYGAMEALGSPPEVQNMPLEKRNVPIFDLTPFTVLFDWTIAIERFLETGNAEMIKDIGMNELKPLLADTKGKRGGEIRHLIESLDRFSRNVSTCRAPELQGNMRDISEGIPQAEKDLELLKPFKPLFGKIQEEFSMNTADDVILGLEISEWCLKKNLIQQGFTVLRETIVNYVITNFLNINDLKDRKTREKAENMLRGNEILPKEIRNLWYELIEYRNDINHAGWTNNMHKADKFKNKLQDFIQRFRNIIKTDF
ncbi:TIGR02221 family CRISPR-associated protein [Methanothermobacter sp. K4]|uniref:TIGR02221 family CRISPR-associated protein n=1 Tax=Methanothermobacter sp. K4 TaxID=2913262 RepID=UPI001EDB7DFF|nr:TIGR02221 family CRISPR-associated protein [Methanothermobacter sp. K4]MCG2828258.1 TIGR02221 family CRISPR-associated protein [Methanothermobacter sp. K4]